jgi:hypothetical protein
MLPPVARRGLVINVRFEPGRLAVEHLRLAYRLIVPIRRQRTGRRVAVMKQVEPDVRREIREVNCR